jgi:hypothetical protein
MYDHSADQMRISRLIEEGDLDGLRYALKDHDRPLSLKQALDVLEVIRTKKPHNFDRAAARWIARLILEREVGLQDIERVVLSIDVLMGVDRAAPEEMIDRPESKAEREKPKPWIVPAT